LRAKRKTLFEKSNRGVINIKANVCKHAAGLHLHTMEKEGSNRVDYKKFSETVF